MSEIVRDVIDRALEAYRELTEVGEELEDEWTYVNDLSEAWRDRLDQVMTARGDDLLDEEAAAAVDRAIDEIGRVADPHRAIDWLSTFPMVVLLALRERP